MEQSFLVVSNPPHPEFDPDTAAQLLGLTPAEVRMKANFAAPEIWLVFPNGEEATEALALLEGTGLRAKAIDGAGLLAVPGPAPVASFAFTEEGFLGRLPEGEAILPYDAPTLGVFCKPPAGFNAAADARASSSPGRRRTTLAWPESVAGAGHESHGFEALELLANLDLFTGTDGEVRRVSISQGLADFSGLGDLKRPASQANLEVFLSECERLFGQLTLDTRLKDVFPRKRLQVGGAAEDHEGRRLFSFGTRSLSQLLESVDPELRHLTQFELGSRLSFLLNRGAKGGG